MVQKQKRHELWFSALGVAELMSGLAIMPDGQRKIRMAIDVRSEITRLFGGRILPFDEEAAHAYASIHARMRKSGRGMETIDSQIAAIAEARKLVIATRDVTPFRDAGLEVINPWMDE